MYRFLIYRFSKFIPKLTGMLFIFCLSTGAASAQDDPETDTLQVVAPPVDEYEEDEDDDYTASQYQPTPPALRQVSDSVVKNLQQDEDFAYANDPEYLKLNRQPPRPRTNFWEGFNNFFKGSVVRTIAYSLLIAFFIFVIYRIIVVNQLYLFYSSKKARANDEQEEEDIHDEHIDEKIRKAINEKDYRSAVRFQYLKGLRLLSDKGWIKYHAQATNHDYVYQLSRYPVAGDFRFLTQVYDYVWYGEFAVNDEQFTRLQSNFQNFYQAVR